MPPLPTLAGAIDQIYTAMQEVIDTELGEGNELETVKTVVLGDRATPAPRTPALWLFPQAATNDGTTFGLRETWTMPLSIVSLIVNTKPEEGYREANALAAQARKVVLSNRSLALPFVLDVISVGFDPARQNGIDNLIVYSAAAIVAVRFNSEG